MRLVKEQGAKKSKKKGEIMIKFSWEWSNGWPRYQINDKPWCGLISAYIYFNYVTEYSSGTIRVSKERLFEE
jgi:hypothetical protein